MSRIAALNRRYAAAATVARDGVEIIAIGDPAGARLDAAVRRLLLAVREDGPGPWDDLASAARALRWRRMTQPHPTGSNPALIEASDHVRRQAARLQGAVADADLLEELAAAAQAVSGEESPLAAVLVRRINEVGPLECVVVAASKPAQMALTMWLRELGTRVLTAGELEREEHDANHAYVVGPPRFFRSSLVTAPVTSGISFLLPAWFGDRSIPLSALAPYADGAMRVVARVSTVGDSSDLAVAETATGEEEDFLPQPSWGVRVSADREPGPDEVVARKVLLSGNFAIFLDDGDRIRALDPDQPPGERVVYVDVDAVRPGTYLLLRQGETERGALLQAALDLLSATNVARSTTGNTKAQVIDRHQGEWKLALASRLAVTSYERVVRELRARGVRAAERVRAWTDSSLIRPSRDEDFEALLTWLDIPIQPTFGLATKLRRAHHQASANLRDQLERAVSKADLSVLERDGHWRLDTGREGVRGLIATRVQAISPHMEIVSRHDARVPFEDRSGRWLE